MKKPPIQKHHIIYANEKPKREEVVVKVFQGEHWIISMIARRKNISKGFIKSLKFWILLNEDKAVDLDKEEKL